MADVCRYVLLQSFAEHRQALVRFLTRRLGNPALAADLAQETWLRIAHKRGSAVRGSPRSHLFDIASSVVVDHQRRTRSADASGSTPQTASGNVVFYRSEFARVVRAIDRLPSACREIFLLCRFEGVSHADIASRLGISRNAVVSHMVNALAAIEREMDAPR